MVKAFELHRRVYDLARDTKSASKLKKDSSQQVGSAALRAACCVLGWMLSCDVCQAVFDNLSCELSGF